MNRIKKNSSGQALWKKAIEVIPGGNGLLSGSSSAQVTQGDINESKLLLFTDGGSGAAQDVAMVLYDEGSASEANFNTELVLASVLKSVDIAALTHDNFWG